MLYSGLPIYLASKSPRRKKLLRQIGLKFKQVSVDLHEEILDGEHPVQTVKRLAVHKLDAALLVIKKGIVITADTIVVLEHEIIGKPVNKKDAADILNKLSGRTHYVYTGYALYNTVTKKRILGYDKSAVTFREISVEEIIDYIATDSPMDKAGAYGIQDDFGAVFVKKISGCYYNVVGLPLSKFYSSLQKII